MLEYGIADDYYDPWAVPGVVQPDYVEPSGGGGIVIEPPPDIGTTPAADLTAIFEPPPAPGVPVATEEMILPPPPDIGSTPWQELTAIYTPIEDLGFDPTWDLPPFGAAALDPVIGSAPVPVGPGAQPAPRQPTSGTRPAPSAGGGGGGGFSLGGSLGGSRSPASQIPRTPIRRAVTRQASSNSGLLLVLVLVGIVLLARGV